MTGDEAVGMYLKTLLRLSSRNTDKSHERFHHIPLPMSKHITCRIQAVELIPSVVMSRLFFHVKDRSRGDVVVQPYGCGTVLITSAA